MKIYQLIKINKTYVHSIDLIKSNWFCSFHFHLDAMRLWWIDLLIKWNNSCESSGAFNKIASEKMSTQWHGKSASNRKQFINETNRLQFFASSWNRFLCQNGIVQLNDCWTNKKVEIPWKWAIGSNSWMKVWVKRWDGKASVQKQPNKKRPYEQIKLI